MLGLQLYNIFKRLFCLHFHSDWPPLTPQQMDISARLWVDDSCTSCSASYVGVDDRLFASTLPSAECVPSALSTVSAQRRALVSSPGSCWPCGVSRCLRESQDAVVISVGGMLYRVLPCPDAQIGFLRRWGMYAHPQCLPSDTLSLSEARPGRFGRQQSLTDIYHTIPYHTIPSRD